MKKSLIINNKGYNLIFMSVIILALGILMSATLGYYSTNNIKKRTFQTLEKFKQFDTALQNYLIANNRFPCPGPLNCDSNGCTLTSNAMGVERRDSAGNCVADNAAVFKSSSNILYGAIPAVSLGISNTNIADGWGNKIVYMIPEELTRKDGFQKFLRNKYNSESVSYINDELLYLLISFAKNTNGAYSYNNKRSAYFSTSITENMPTSSFTINANSKKYIISKKTPQQFSVKGLENEIQECPEIITTQTVEVDAADEDGDEVCQEFSYTGGVQTFTVPKGIEKIKIEIWGASGGSTTKASGGKGGYSYGFLNVHDGNKISIKIGGAGTTASGGYNGGGAPGNSTAGGGGGRSEATFNGTLLIVAGGGGGSGNGIYSGGDGGGGSLGGLYGSSTSTCGGAGGVSGVGGSKVANCGNQKFNTGTSTTGGNGLINGTNVSGGGGGGYGGGASGSHEHGGGGGGGYIGGVVSGGGKIGVNIGNGKARICYNTPAVSGPTIHNYTFKKAKYGEIRFAEEECPTKVSRPAKASDYYYISQYYASDSGTSVDNRPAKKCGKNGKWESGYEYACVLAPKCTNPVSVFGTAFQDFNFPVVNTGEIVNVSSTLRFKCLYSKSRGTYWFRVN